MDAWRFADCLRFLAVCGLVDTKSSELLSADPLIANESPAAVSVYFDIILGYCILCWTASMAILTSPLHGLNGIHTTTEVAKQLLCLVMKTTMQDADIFILMSIINNFPCCVLNNAC